ncbi:hypothetical protein B0T19DRAFT_252627 [Cercophora scortea]|uniref:Pentatricopeptide repeat domain-containing protein n=1 Tax=Cercophora scortea TaxID=314031 RepID=A0AAE0I986_9PEZI|nr:hypothetical protein B0T19DRAFT_252627 [Cercophora scortea]
MQRIWSTAAQLRGCHCRTCVRPTIAAAVQATNPKTPGRRNALASHVFTACYAGVIASAAIIDDAREHRHRDNECRTPEARSAQAARARALALAMEQTATRDLAQIVTSADYYTDVFDRRVQRRIDALNSICRYRPGYLLAHREKQKTRWKSLDQLRKICSPNGWYGHKKMMGQGIDRCDDAIALEETDPFMPQREARSPLQFARATDMINDLVDQLLKVAYNETETQFPRTHPALGSPDSAWTAIRLLRSDGYPRYSHPELDPEATIKARARLNEVNSNIMRDWQVPRREHFVAKICYNLLVSTIPPGIQNYNVLILGFTRLGEHGLAQAVVDSFLYKSHFIPTKATVLCLLQHFRLKRDVVGFYAMLRRVIAHDCRGIGIKRRKIDEVKKSGQLRRWAVEADVGFSGGYVVELPKMDSALYEAMIQGLVDFKMTGHAAKVFVVCLQEKGTISAEVLDYLLHACIRTMDDLATRVLIHGLITNVNEAASLILGTELSNATVRKIRHLLNMRRAKILDTSDTPSLGPRVDIPTRKDPLIHLTTALWIREVEGDLFAMKEDLRRIGKALSQEGPLETRLDLALSWAKVITARPWRALGRTEAIWRLAKLDWVSEQCDASQALLEQTQHKIYNTMARSIPRPVRGDTLFDTTVSAEQRLSLNRLLRIPGTVQHHIGICFSVSQQLDSRLKVAILHALPEPDVAEFWGETRGTADTPLGGLFVKLSRYLESFSKGVKDSIKSQGLDTDTDRKARSCVSFNYSTTSALENRLLGAAVGNRGIVPGPNF